MLSCRASTMVKFVQIEGDFMQDCQHLPGELPSVCHAHILSLRFGASLMSGIQFVDNRSRQELVIFEQRRDMLCASDAQCPIGRHCIAGQQLRRRKKLLGRVGERHDSIPVNFLDAHAF